MFILDSLLIGGLLGFVLACLLISLPFINGQFVHRWQDLIAGLIATAAAALALWAVRQQIQQAQKMEDCQRRSNFWPARRSKSRPVAMLAL